MVTPLRAYIVCVIILTICILLSPLNSEGDYAFLLLLIYLIPSFTLIPAIFIEIILTLLRHKISKTIFLILSFAGIFISILGTILFLSFIIK